MKRDFLLDLDGCALLSEAAPGLFEPMQMDYEISGELQDAGFPHHFVLIALAASDFDVIFLHASELLYYALMNVALLAILEHNLEVYKSLEDRFMFFATSRAGQNVNLETPEVVHYKRRFRFLFLDMPGTLDCQRGLA